MAYLLIRITGSEGLFGPFGSNRVNGHTDCDLSRLPQLPRWPLLSIKQQVQMCRRECGGEADLATSGL